MQGHCTKKWTHTLMVPCVVEAIQEQRNDVGGCHFMGRKMRDLVRASECIQVFDAIPIKRVCDGAMIALAFGQLRNLNGEEPKVN